MEGVPSAGSARPLRILSLDGGGIRGLSELVILETIMHQVRRDGNLETEPLPADYFDLICGTSTGGLIAILLGRLRLSVSQAVKKYGELSKHVFSEQKRGLFSDGRFKATNLEEAIRKVLVEELGEGQDEELMLEAGRVPRCKTFVCAVPARNVSTPRLFRSYESKNPAYPAKIWQVARATSAAPRIFKSIKIGEKGMEEEFVDGGLGHNNPTDLAIQEVINEYNLEHRVACILSIGTGQAKVSGFSSAEGSQRLFPTELINVLKDITTDCKKIADRLSERFIGCPGLYHRLNVEIGLDDITLGEWNRLAEVKTHTIAYVDSREVQRKIQAIVEILLGRVDTSYPLQSLDGKPQVAAMPPLTLVATTGLFLYPSSLIPKFVDRPEVVSALERHLDFDSIQGLAQTSSPTVVVLQGMAGCGKTQLALQYCIQARQNRSYKWIFWIDATSPETAMQDFTRVASALFKPAFSASETEANLQFVRAALDTKAKKEERWILVFDNFDNPKFFREKRIEKFFPQATSGSIIITTRQAAVRNLGHFSLEVSWLTSDEALTVLLSRFSEEVRVTDISDAVSIVGRLGNHALAIDRASAYMRTRGMSFSAYLDLYNRLRGALQNESSEIWDYSNISKDSAEGAATDGTLLSVELEMSLKSLSGTSAARNDKEHILTLMAFFEIEALENILFAPYGRREKEWMNSCQGANGWRQETFQDILLELHNLSLVYNLNIDRSKATFFMHPLVRDWLQARIGDQKAEEYLAESIRVLSEYLQAYEINDDFSDAGFAARDFLFPHVHATMVEMQRIHEPSQFLYAHGLLDAMYLYCRLQAIRGFYQDAEKLCIAVLEGRRLDGTRREHLNTLTNLQNLSTYLLEQGKYKQAERCIHECVDTFRVLYGMEAAQTIRAMNYWIRLMIVQERNDEADHLSQELVERSMTVLGRDHEDTIFSVRNRAEVLRCAGKLVESETMHRSNLALSERVLGNQHPETSAIMHNLALCLNDGRKFTEAEPLLLQELDLRRKDGEGHPGTIASTFMLACYFCEQGRQGIAEELFQTAYLRCELLDTQDTDDTYYVEKFLADCLRDFGKGGRKESIQILLEPLEKRVRDKMLLRASGEIT